MGFKGVKIIYECFRDVILAGCLCSKVHFLTLLIIIYKIVLPGFEIRHLCLNILNAIKKAPSILDIHVLILCRVSYEYK